MINSRAMHSQAPEILFTTDHFTVLVARDNQKTPGILDILVNDTSTKTWEDLSVEQLVGLNATQKKCEKLLVSTFYAVALAAGRSEESILINFYARQIREGGKDRLSIRIYPRYSNEQVFHFDNETLKDPTPGKPFEYAKPVVVTDSTYLEIVQRLRAQLKLLNIEQPKQVAKNHDKCFMCKHPSEHVDKVGLMQVSVQVDDQSYRFNISLDARDQRHPGRGYVVPVGHISALRHSSDLSIALAHLIANAYQRAAENVFNEDKNSLRTYDRAVLMNLYKAEEGGPHVHMHIIPRPNVVGYELEYPMLAKDYIPVTDNADKKQEMVFRFCRELHEQLGSDMRLRQAGRVDFTYLADNVINTNTYNKPHTTLFAERREVVEDTSQKPANKF